MSAYDEAAAAFLEAAAPVAAYCERTARPNKHAEMLETFLLRGAQLGAEADNLQRGYEGSERIRNLCAGIRERIGHMLGPQVPDHLRPVLSGITSHCLPLPAHARLDRPEPLCCPASHAEGPDCSPG